MQPIIFENLDNTDRRILELADDLGYLKLDEVTGRNTVEPIARIDFTALDLNSYIELSNEIDSTPERLARGASVWIRRVVADNMTGRGLVKFKISLWRPKGDGLMHSARFIAHNPNVDDGEPGEAAVLRAMPPPQPTIALESPSGQPNPSSAAWAALENGYRNLLGVMQEAYGGLTHAHAHQAAMSAEAHARQAKEISKLHAMVEELHGKMLLIKVGQAEIEQTGRESETSAAHREAMMKQFLSELGSIGRIVASSKLGVSPELGELASIVEESPDLKAALTDPDIRDLLKDQATAKELAALLKGIVANEKARKAANSPPTEQKAA